MAHQVGHLDLGGGGFFGATAEDFLVDDPRSAFFSFASRFDRSPAQRRFFQSQFPFAQDIFGGEQASSLLSGMFPTETFTEFTGRFPFLERFLAQSPRARGDREAQLSPRTAFSFPTRR